MMIARASSDHTPADDVTAQQRRRSAALVAAVVVLVAAGALARLRFDAAAPGACAECTGARAWLIGAPVDVNAATQRQLEAIPGVGPSLARAIVEERARRGGFARIEELDDVDGVGPKTLEKLRAFVTVPARVP